MGESASGAVTDELKALAPDAAAYFDARASAWRQDLAPYLAEVAALETTAAGRPYAATESVFAYMAEAIGLEDRTPRGYATSAANESEPSPGDIHAFEELLRGDGVDVLVFNTQTEGSVPGQLRSVAEGADVPVVEVTESVPTGQPSFVAWQLDQLRALAAALSG